MHVTNFRTRKWREAKRGRGCLDFADDRLEGIEFVAIGPGFQGR